MLKTFIAEARVPRTICAIMVIDFLVCIGAIITSGNFEESPVAITTGLALLPLGLICLLYAFGTFKKDHKNDRAVSIDELPDHLTEKPHRQ